MITDKQYSELSDAVYWLDPKHRDYVPEMQENLSFKINGTMYKILKIKDSLDGMQAMAVAPIVHSKLENKNFKNKKILANFRVLK
ncbi:hypothetical protein A5816_000365 [Enterococcus sp. 3G1_DIV0629]|uniref:hypothetical protein n=1 Tax=Enterococcus sp. (strain 3G1_DIV0629) TaxID=1834176 RepID=UPI000A33F4D5|nr:hypothetical protein [Enterococcus sp. 3G1_DIV0629]EME8124681.1 hypothetical protein [Enterococcus faecium]OTO28099.1 hypothetical protein A5816_000365 [Enterococcus sp. 3G1_DIV0629]